MLSDLKSMLSYTLLLKVLAFILLCSVLWQMKAGMGNVSMVDKPLKPKIVSALQDEQSALQSEKLSSRLDTPLFGEFVPSNLHDFTVRPSRSNLKVVGIMFAQREADSQVIISAANGRALLFQVGDTLPGGGVIKRITVQGVLMSRDGVLERLSLPENKLRFEPPPKPLFEESF